MEAKLINRDQNYEFRSQHKLLKLHNQWFMRQQIVRQQFKRQQIARRQFTPLHKPVQSPSRGVTTTFNSAKTRGNAQAIFVHFLPRYRLKIKHLRSYIRQINQQNSPTVIFIFASSRLVERASRREHLSTSREVDVADAARTIDERLGMLEDAVRSLSAEFALFTLNNVLKNQAPTGQAQTNRAPPIHTSELTRTVPKSWCYYHVRFGKDARKCSSDLCTFSPKISTENKTFKKLYTLDKPEQRTYRYNTWTDF
ncbi:hypothetical protein AGLY_017904 [Aphis glycines]|uniref:Uncharacterized protein n=1 Tax=Aphis glycines TaxID=307491 RepID=A0A6G0SVG9_APHGL|nr:hypothetical protein AGLY_017904 [Aphis glycines]